MLASRTAQHADAARYFARAVALAPSPLLHLRHGDALLESGHPAEARSAYELARQAPEAEPAARYGLGRVALASGNADAARTEFGRAIALVPAFGAAHYGLAQLQRKAGDLTAARASLDRQQACLACWPMPPDRWDARLAGLRTDAAALLRRGVHVAGSLQADVDAIRLHEDALARDPALGQARVNLISLYARTGNLEKAQAQYRAVIAAGTHLADAHHAFGLALAAAGDVTQAEPILRKAVHSNPFDAAAHNALGLIDEAARRVPEAEASYLRAVDADPRVRAFRFNYARVLANTGRLDDALAQLLRLHVPDDAESARYMYATSALYARKGDIGEARRLGTKRLRAHANMAPSIWQVPSNVT